MKFHRLYPILLLIFLTVSCVPVKNLEYLQPNGNTDDASAISPYPVKPYRIQTNDILSISVKALDPKIVQIFNTNEGSQTQTSEQALYFTGYTVDDHGNIRMPVLGEVNVLGYTLEEIRVKIEESLLKDHFNTSAGIYVTVKLAGLRITINGEVGSPGTRAIFQDKVTIMEAIANAGDITMVGDRKHVKVFRQFPKGIETFTIDLTDSNAIKSPCYYLQPNDYVYVRPLDQKSWGTGKTGIESIGTIITILSLATTTFLLLKK